MNGFSSYIEIHLDIDKHILGQDGFWLYKIKPPLAKDRTVGILGLGTLGKPVAVLKKIGFKVLDGVEHKKN